MSCAQMALLFTHLSPERSWARRNLTKTKMPSIMVFGSLEEEEVVYVPGAYSGDL